MRKPNRFTPVQIARWRSVPVGIVIKVGNACCPGVDFGGCTKRSVYSRFEEGNTDIYPGIDVVKFTAIMNDVSRIVIMSNAALKKEVFLTIAKYAS